MELKLGHLSKQVRHKLSVSRLHATVVWLRHRKLAAGDVVVASYPRSGTTWLRFLLYEILSGQAAQFETVNKAIPEVGRGEPAPFLRQGARLLATHEPYRKEYRRAIYLVRDVRDVLISLHAYQQWANIYSKDLGNFVFPFLEGNVNAYGPWHRHVDSWLNTKVALGEKLIVVKFEDMLRDIEGTLSKVLRFLEIQVEPVSVQNAIANNTIERMRAKEDQARSTLFKDYRTDLRFVRGGTVGGWRAKLSTTQIRLIEELAGAALRRLNYSLL